MEYIKSKLAKYAFYQQKQILHWEWQAETENATWNEVQPAMIEYAEKAELYKAKYHIIDESNMKFLYIPEIQDWIDQMITPRTLASGLKKFALIKSKDIFIEMAVQQIFDEINSSRIEMKMFDNVIDAEKWLLS